MEVSDWLLAVFSANKRVDKLHRPWAIEGHHSDNILKTGGLQVFEIAFHTGRFKLEYTSSFGVLEELIGERVIKRDVVEINIVVIDLTNHTQSIIDHREVGKTQKVHLKKA